MRIIPGSCECLRCEVSHISDSRNKHKDHWKPFDRKNPPEFMLCGEIGIDDKRKLDLPNRIRA